MLGTHFFPDERGRIVNKNDLVASVASSAGLSKADATKAVDAVFESVTSSLKGGNEVRLVGFGSATTGHAECSEADRKSVV